MSCDNCACGIGLGFDSQTPHELYGRQLCDWCHALLRKRGYLKPPVHAGHGEFRQTYWYVENGEWKVGREQPKIISLPRP